MSGIDRLRAILTRLQKYSDEDDLDDLHNEE